MIINEYTIQQMIDELTEVACRLSGEQAHVKVLSRNDANYIQITIPNKTLLDIEFHQLNVPGIE